MEIIADGSHLVIKVNEKTTADYVDRELLYTSGHIVLENDSSKGMIEIRKIEIKEPPTTIPATTEKTTKGKLKDTFQKGSVWEGEYQGITKPDHTFHASWTVTKREGDKFEAVQQNKGSQGTTIDHELVIHGTIVDNKITAKVTKISKGTLGSPEIDEEFPARCSFATEAVSDDKIILIGTIKNDKYGNGYQEGKFIFARTK